MSKPYICKTAYKVGRSSLLYFDKVMVLLSDMFKCRDAIASKKKKTLVVRHCDTWRKFVDSSIGQAAAKPIMFCDNTSTSVDSARPLGARHSAPLTPSRGTRLPQYLLVGSGFCDDKIS